VALGAVGNAGAGGGGAGVGADGDGLVAVGAGGGEEAFQFGADGAGAERDLDLHEIVSTTNSLANGAAGTNGWYAVNGGRLLYPRAWISAASITRNQGEPPFKTALEMVNSVQVTLTGAQNPTFLRAGLCAPDRSDIPPGLPPGLRLGVWCIGLYPNNTTASATSTFGAVSLTFRYDHTRVKAGDTLRLFRYASGAWVKVGECAPDGTSLIATDAPLARLTSGAYNIGWFALLASPFPGLRIAVQ
jgi:hypothetical protein